MQHGIEFVVVLVAVGSLAVGAAMRGFSRRTKVPYTIAVLLMGGAAGSLLRHGALGAMGPAVQHAAEISPDLIIFVFLPALIFESAFALEVYGFRRNLGVMLALAVPALLVSCVLSGLAMMVLTDGSWGWQLGAGLVFGALISATDPVAVVAMLRELGAPKRLGLLIEGESLMNDGTAIVVFNVLLGMVAGGGGSIAFGAASLDFLRVVLGGVLVGAVLGMGATAWLSRTFNDPLVEITLTLVLAYSAMLVAEGVFHVSGVMALVTAGLWMSSLGRTRISPEVFHFLHQFWGMLAYIANTMIFFLVGLVISTHLETASWRDLLIVFGAYVAVMIVRFTVTFAFLPVMNRLGDPLSAAQATVMSWGGLRGAVSLALALVVSQHPGVPVALRGQILLVTAGVVLLTIVLNGSTIGALLSWFGFDQRSVPEQLAHAHARAGVLAGVEKKVGEAARTQRTVEWRLVEQELRQKRAEVAGQMQTARDRLAGAPGSERAEGYWRQALSVERQVYWTLFGQGALGPRAVRVLNREIDIQLDRLARGDVSAPASRMAALNDPLAWTARALRRAGVQIPAVQFEHLSLVHALARAQNLAGKRVVEFVDGMEDADADVSSAIRGTYQGFAREAVMRLEDLYLNAPEVTHAIEARLARRMELNFEREDYEALARDGVLDEESARSVLDEVETAMKRLLRGQTHMALPETAELVRSAPLFSGLDDETMDLIAELTREQVFSTGETLFEQGDRGDTMYIIARGAVQVIVVDDGHEEVVEVLGSGDIMGEMAVLSGEPRRATIRALTTVTVGEIRRAPFQDLMKAQPTLAEGIWLAFGERAFDNLLRGDPAFRALDHAARLAWFRSGRSVDWPQATRHRVDGGSIFVLTGQVGADGQTWQGPTLLAGDEGRQFEAIETCRVTLLPFPPSPPVR